MKILRAAAGLACILMPLAGAPAQPPASVAQSARPVAVEQVAIENPGQAPMVVNIWHPAALPGGAPADEAGSEASVGGDGLPLVVVSHGTGAGPMSHVDTAQALAGAGFVVVAPMHRGDNFQDDSSVGRPEWMANRARDVSEAIDFMLQGWRGRTHVDPSRVGIFGFSAGATTALISIGGVPDLARLAPHCAARREFACALMAPQAATAALPPPAWIHDRRIAAAVIAAPGLGFTFEPSGLSTVRVPVQLWVGAEDQTVPYETNAAVVRRLLPQPPDFHSVDGAVHLSFLAPCGPDTPRPLCQDQAGFDRSAFHRDFNQAVIDFFRRHLPAPTSAYRRSSPQGRRPASGQ